MCGSKWGCFWFRVLVIFGAVCLLQCKNVATTSIECVPIKLCPMAMKLIKENPYAPETIHFLQYSHCGFEGTDAKIWCTKFLFCKTPDSKDGVCKHIKHCDSYLHLMKNVDTSDPIVKKYLREFRCNTEFDNEVKVCCPERKFPPFPPFPHSFPHYHPFGDDYDFEYPFIKQYFHERVRDRFLPFLPNPQLQECGRQNTDDKIFGGTETYIDEFPWMALLKYRYNGKVQYGCSGSLINGRFILTAAHCVDPTITKRKQIGELQSVVLGEYDTRNETDCIYQKFGTDCADPVQEYNVKNVLIHPEFDSRLMKNDIALIELRGEATFSDYVHPICLPPNKFQLKGNETFSISGWGKTPVYKRSPVKLKAVVKNVDKANCNRLSTLKLQPTQVCAGEGNGMDNCYGDSGGPLMLEQKVGQSFVLFAVGIISYGYGQICGTFPGVYTYIPPYIDWINENIT